MTDRKLAQRRRDTSRFRPILEAHGDGFHCYVLTGRGTVQEVVLVDGEILRQEPVKYVPSRLKQPCVIL